MKTRWIRFTSIPLWMAFAACSPPAEEKAEEPEAPVSEAARLEVAEVRLGAAIDAENNVVEEHDTFAPGDTIYVSIVTRGTAPSATLTARWSFEDGQIVDESTQTIAPTGTSRTEFHVSKPDGWPEGSYKVEIQLDGRTVETKEFEVEA